MGFFTKIFLPTLLITVFLASALAKDDSLLESWATQSVIVSRDILDQDARAVAGGISLKKHKKWGWSPKVESAEGVLIVHPVSEERPAVIKYKISPLQDKSKKLVISARGSDVEPGVILKIAAKDKILKEVVLGRKWQVIDIPLSEVPFNTNEVSIEIFAILYYFEYCYIDYIKII
jgi:hypothetical protein